MSVKGMIRSIMWTELKEAIEKDFPDVEVTLIAPPAINEFVKKNADHITKMSGVDNATA